MNPRYRFGFVLGLIALLVAPLATSVASPTGYDVATEFRPFYDQSGGLPVFGYAVSEPMEEDGRLVQYFERQRMELHPAFSGTHYEVQLGHVGWQDAERRGLLGHDAFQPVPSSTEYADVDYFAETGQTLRGAFRSYWHRRGLNFGDDGVSFRESLALFGYPISEEFVDPDTGLVTQYFERARFEFHPENAGTEHQVLLGHLGSDEMELLRRNGGGGDVTDPPRPRALDSDSDQSVPEPTPEPTPEATPEPGTDDRSQSNDELTPSISIQEMVDRASPGDTVSVPAGMYRETVRINKPVTLAAEPGAEIRGSDIWKDWTENNGSWVSQDSVPVFENNHGECESSFPHCKRQEQVFVDERALTFTERTPGAGEFSVNDRTQQIILGESPVGKIVEVTVREHWIRGEANDVTIDGFTMKHAAPRAQMGGIRNNGYDNWKIINNDLSHGHGANVSLEWAENLMVTNNDISFAGQVGIHVQGGRWALTGGPQSKNITIAENRIHHNNTAGYREDWDAGGMKVLDSDGIRIENNIVHENNGIGVWCDVDCNNAMIRGNRVHNNSGPGIMYELSFNGEIDENIVYQNAVDSSWSHSWGAGIHIVSSSDTIVRNNVLAWNRDGIIVRSNDWSSHASRVGDWTVNENNHVHDNYIIMFHYDGGDEIAIAWDGSGNGDFFNPANNNRGENNRFYHSNPESASWAPFRWEYPEVFDWSELESFNATAAEVNATYLGRDEVTSILSSRGIPGEPN